MSRSKPIGWITAGTLLCVAGLSIACRLNEGSGSSARAETPPPPSAIVPPPPPPSDASEEASEPKPPSIGASIDNALIGTPAPELKKVKKPMPEPAKAPTPPPPPPEIKVEISPQPPVTPPPAVKVEMKKEKKKPVVTPPTAVKVEMKKEKKPVVAPPAPPKVREEVIIPDVEPLVPTPPKVPTPKVKEEVKAPKVPTPPVSLPPAVAPKVEEKVSKDVPESTGVRSRPNFSSNDEVIPPVPPAPSRPKVHAYIPTLTKEKPVIKVKPKVVERPVAQGPVYVVHDKGLTLKDLAKKSLGKVARWKDIAQLNPHLRLELVVPQGTRIQLPVGADVKKLEVPVKTKGNEEASEPVFRSKAWSRTEDRLAVDHLPIIRREPVVKKDKERSPLTGAYPCKLSSDGSMLVPEGVQIQLEKLGTVLLTPGPDHCLWLSTKDCTECVLKRVEKSYVNDDVVRAFKRLYFAQSEKTTISSQGRLWIPGKLAKYAELGTDLIVIGMDDHFEVWDAKRWYQYSTQKTSGSAPYGRKRTVIKK